MRYYWEKLISFVAEKLALVIDLVVVLPDLGGIVIMTSC